MRAQDEERKGKIQSLQRAGVATRIEEYSWPSMNDM